MENITPMQEAAIIRYLLGDLPESETEKIEERYFADGVFFEHVTAVEDLLIRNYLDRSLSANEVQLFERKYLRVPALQDKVALASGLRAVAVAERTQVYRYFLGRPWNFWLSWASPAFAVLALVLFMASWRIFHSASPPIKGESMQAEHPAAESKTVGVAGISGSTKVLSAVVLPGLTKGLGSLPQRLSLSPGLQEIRLELELPGAHQDLTARVDVLRVENDRLQLVWSRDAIPSVPTVSGRTILVSMKPAVLTPGDYVIYLGKPGAPPRTETIETYSFGVVKP